MKRLVSAAAIVLACGVVQTWAANVDCEPARYAVQTAIAARLSVVRRRGQSRALRELRRAHRQGVRCRRHRSRELQGQGRALCRKSTCGKPGFVRCLIPTDTCVVDPVTLLGTCAENPTLACVIDVDCGAKCKTKSSSDRLHGTRGHRGRERKLLRDVWRLPERGVPEVTRAP